MKVIVRALSVLILAFGMFAGSLGPASAARTPTPSGDISILEAPVGKRCGAYLTGREWGDQLRYWHCGDSWITVEIDMRGTVNRNQCVGPWQDVFLAYYQYADHAWYAGITCR